MSKVRKQIPASVKQDAKRIAEQLDKIDGKNNRIEAETWRKHAVANYGAKDNVSVFIEKSRAEKSIAYYINREASKTQENTGDIAERWFNKLKDQEPDSEYKGNEEDIVTYDGGTKPEVVITSSKKSVLNISSKLPVINEPVASIEEVPVSTHVAKVNVQDEQYTVIPDTNGTDNFTSLKIKADTKKIRTNIESFIKQEIAKRRLKESNIDINYWVDRIARVSSDFNIPYEIIVSIISRENAFTKNISSQYGQGAMAITGIAIRDFFPAGKGNWNEVYEQLDKDLLQDILYKKDEAGNLLKDTKGNPILKYKSADELRNACGKNDELSMKIGSLVFEMKYAKAVALKVFGRANFLTVPKAIKMLKNNEVYLSEKENKRCINLAVKNYNGCDMVVKRNGKFVKVQDDYVSDVMDSLNVRGYDFSKQIIVKET